MWLRLILLAPPALLLVLFAVSNREAVSIGMWPTGVSVTMPISAAILLAMGIAFFLGALLVWFGSLAHRRRARRAESKLAALEAEIATLRRRMPA